MAFALFIPCLPLLWIQLKTGSQATFALPGWGRLVNLSFLKALPLTFIKFSLGRITIFNKTIYALVAGFLFLIYGFFLAKGFWLKEKERTTKAFWMVVFWLVLPIGMAWLVSIVVPNYQPFRLLFVLPAFYLLLANGLFQISMRRIKIAGVAFILLVNLACVGVYYQNPYFHREDWRGAVRFIEQKEGKSLVILPSETSHWPYTYYSQGKIPLVGLAKSFGQVQQKDLSQEIIADKEKIYYLYYLADLFDPQGMITDWLESQKFVKEKEVSFNQIRIQEWSK
jgi:hypothetical protein